MAIVYKIYRKTDGLFSMGGSTPKFNKVGKIWKQKGHLTNHLNQVDFRPIRDDKHVYSDCEIIPYELTETQVGPGFTISEYLDERERKKEEAKLERQKRREEWEKEQRRKQYKKLKEEFE